jgi:hypothetical protein
MGDTWVHYNALGAVQCIACNYQSLIFKSKPHTWRHKKVGKPWQHVGHVHYMYI